MGCARKNQIELSTLEISKQIQKSEHEQRIQTSHSFRRRDQSVSHGRSGNTRALRYSSRYSEWRICFHRRTVGLREIDVALDSGIARYPERGQLFAQGIRGRQPFLSGACPHSQSGNRVHFPKLQPHWRSHGLRERRVAADISRDELGRSQGGGDTGVGASWDGTS